MSGSGAQMEHKMSYDIVSDLSVFCNNNALKLAVDKVNAWKHAAAYASLRLSKAVLQYVEDRKVLDMQTINVPYRYSGQGLARLLAETACTYAILNCYFMYLSCEYMQKYFLAFKYPALEDCVVGPPHILEGPAPEPVDSIFVCDMLDPEDFLIYTT